MPESPNLNLKLTAADDLTTNVHDWVMDQSGTKADSNMMIIDQALGNIEDWRSRQFVFSSSQPGNQEAGDIWNELIS